MSLTKTFKSKYFQCFKIETTRLSASLVRRVEQLSSSIAWQVLVEQNFWAKSQH